MNIKHEHLKKEHYQEMRSLGCTFKRTSLFDEPITARELSSIRQRMEGVQFGNGRGKVADRLNNYYRHLQKCSEAKGWKAEYEAAIAVIK